MNRKYLAIAIIMSSLALIAGIVYFFFFYNFQPPAEEPAVTESPGRLSGAEETPAVLPAETPAANPVRTPASRPAAREMSEADLKKMAGSFAERFGSFSNQSNYANIEDLIIFMTASMKNWAENFISSASKGSGDSSIYYGITTKAITAETKSFNPEAGAAEILVKTQRKEATGAMSNFRFFYQDILITFNKEGAWKVNSAVWLSN